MNCPKWPIQPKTKLNLISVDPKWHNLQILTPFKYKNVRCPIFLLRRREIDWFYFYVPNGRLESKKKPLHDRMDLPHANVCNNKE